MRLPLAITLKNRSNSLTKDARLLNAVVDSKQKVMKRPSLFGKFEAPTVGAGLGLFVRNTPHAPDGGSGEELIVIAGSQLTTGPAAYSEGDVFNMIAANLGGGIGYGYFAGFGGSLTPTTLHGITISALLSDADLTNVTYFLFPGILPQTFFTSLTWNGVTLLSSTATFTHPGGTSQWAWSPAIVNATGPYVVTVA